MSDRRIPLAELEAGVPFARRHIGPDAEAQAKMLAQVGYGSLDELTDAAVPAAIRSAEALGLPAALHRGRGARRAARAGRPQRGAGPDDRPRLLRHLHPAGHPAQRHGEPRLVHGLHAVPAGDLAGPPGGAAQLPDHGRRPHRAAHLRGVPAGREHRRRRGDGAVPAGRQGQGRRLPGRRRHLPADRRRHPDPRRAHRRRGRRRRPGRRHPGRGRRARCLRRAAPVPGRLRGRPRPARRSSSARTNWARSSPSPPTCSP